MNDIEKKIEETTKKIQEINDKITQYTRNINTLRQQGLVLMGKIEAYKEQLEQNNQDKSFKELKEKKK